MATENPFSKQTKTDETKAFYLKRANGFRLRCADFFSIEEDELDSVHLANYLATIAPELSRATVRLYKSMLLYYFEVNPDEYTATATDVVKEISVINSPKRTDKTSSLRGKSMSERTFASVIYALSLPEYKGKYTNLTSLWLQAGALTGLRPHEWQHATLESVDNDLILKIRNGKTTNDRSHGEYRHLHLAELSMNEKRIIEQFMMMINPYCDSDDHFRKIQTACMQTLRKLNLRLEKGGFFTKEQGFSTQKGSGVYFRNNKGKRVQLYTGRHRFSSVMKKIAELSEVAAMMGHKTDRTATLHYGRTDVHHSSTRRPRPAAEEVEKVERKHALNRKIQKAPTPAPTPNVKPSFKP